MGNFFYQAQNFFNLTGICPTQKQKVTAKTTLIGIYLLTLLLY